MVDEEVEFLGVARGSAPGLSAGTPPVLRSVRGTLLLSLTQCSGFVKQSWPDKSLKIQALIHHVSTFLFTSSLSLLFLLSSCFVSVTAQQRLQNINGGWKFHKGDIDGFPAKTTAVAWQTVNLPHTWNAKDVFDDVPGYYRGISWYKRALPNLSRWKGKDLFLYFEGANQVATVYINGKKAGGHIGGYTGFTIPLSGFIDFSVGAHNEIEVAVDNSFNEDIPPLTADFTFYGGIYRDVYLLAADPVHFNYQSGETGVFVTTPKVSAATANVQIKVDLGQIAATSQKIRLTATLRNAEGATIRTSSVAVNPGTQERILEMKGIIRPRLWSPEHPYLYTVITQLTDASTGKVLDEVQHKLGFRWFRFDADSGFFLNGEPCKLIGASRHQDEAGKGNALSDADHLRDIKLLKQMGANFLRVAHYPQDPAILNACDSLGILTSVEIPIVNTITESAEFTANCLDMQREMIRQNFNHPSVILWAYMNEVLLRPKFAGDKMRQQEYFDHITALAEQLESLTRKEDPSRYTMISNHGDFNKYNLAKLTQIPMVIGWNLYQGWYGGKQEDFAVFLDKAHKDLPGKPLLVTEYGADADPRIRSTQPEKFDKSIEYALGFHQVYLRTIRDRAFLAGAAIWNLADFNSETREETMPHVNNKGMLTADRKPKDLYRFYQSEWLQSPFIRFSDQVLRSGITEPGNSLTRTGLEEVFTNLPGMKLRLNGKQYLPLDTVNDRHIWKLPFIEGNNKLEAWATFKGRTYKAATVVTFHGIPSVFGKAVPGPLNILLGGKRSFIDGEGLTWIPGQTYIKGGWGNIGGTPFKIKDSGRQQYGTDRDILKTENDPIYQTQLASIQQFRFDVPDGKYTVTLHFAEFSSDETKEALAYNLDTSAGSDKAANRVFDILVNGSVFRKAFDIRKTYGTLTAGAEILKINATNGAGIVIGFRKISGEPVLNAVQLARNKNQE